MKKRKKKEMLMIVGALLVFFGCLIGILLFIFTNGKTTYITEDTEYGAVSALDCTASGIEGAFFSSETANTVKHKVKATFANDKVSKLFYDYEGVYRDYDVAEHDNAVLHAKYNQFMSGHGQEQESLTPTFNTVKTKLRINLYAKGREIINSATAVLFFVKENDYTEYMGYSREQVAEYYKKQGFSCEMQN